jgi:hypothetical protein
MSIIQAPAVQKISAEPSIDDIEFADTLIDPYALVALRKAWPGVRFVPVTHTDLDPCCGCPEGLMDPLPAQLVLNYRVGSSCWFHEPVGGCCAAQELTWHDQSARSIRDLYVSVLREPLPARAVA